MNQKNSSFLCEALHRTSKSHWKSQKDCFAFEKSRFTFLVTKATFLAQFPSKIAIYLMFEQLSVHSVEKQIFRGCTILDQLCSMWVYGANAGRIWGPRREIFLTIIIEILERNIDFSANHGHFMKQNNCQSSFVGQYSQTGTYKAQQSFWDSLMTFAGSVKCFAQKWGVFLVHLRFTKKTPHFYAYHFTSPAKLIGNLKKTVSLLKKVVSLS